MPLKQAFINRLPRARQKNMNKKKITLGIILAILGLIGVASILTMEIPLPPEA
jgi:phosphoribosylpyrophosphate synthetase